MAKKPALQIVLALFMAFLLLSAAKAQTKLNAAIAGLSHDHVYLIRNSYQKGEVNIVGIAERDTQLVARFKKRYQIPGRFFLILRQIMLR